MRALLEFRLRQKSTPDFGAVDIFGGEVGVSQRVGVAAKLAHRLLTVFVVEEEGEGFRSEKFSDGHGTSLGPIAEAATGKRPDHAVPLCFIICPMMLSKSRKPLMVNGADPSRRLLM